MNANESCLAVLCGGCGLVIFSALSSWCNLNAFGSRGCCGGQRGCCGSCFDAGFNQDAWEVEEAKRAAEQPGADPKKVASAEQPGAVAGMEPKVPDAAAPEPATERNA